MAISCGMRYISPLIVTLASLWLLPFIAAEPPGVVAPPATDSAEETVDSINLDLLFSRVVCVGASATNGVGTWLDEGDRASLTGATNMGRVFKAGLRTENPKVANYSDLMFFQNSSRNGLRLWRKTLRARPTLIIGIDFLFWYGYGDRTADGSRLTEESERLELFEAGLKLLEEADCPVVVGNFPNMRAAVGGMLAASQMPEDETLEKLNKRLHEWGSERDDVMIVEMSSVIEEMLQDKAFEVGDYEWPDGCKRILLQRDELHPTTDGLVALSQCVAAVLEERFGFDGEVVFDFDPDVIKKKLGAR